MTSETQAGGGALEGASARMMAPGPEYDLIRRWVGSWSVRMRLWTEPDATGQELPPMRAQRDLVQDAYLREVMEPAPGSMQPPFTRTAYLSFNNLWRRYEYVSMDSRAPGIMFETSFGDVLEAPETVTVYLDAFPFAGWGSDVAGQLVKQRRTLETVSHATTVCRQYWQLPAGRPYLAVEYVYDRLDHPS